MKKGSRLSTRPARFVTVILLFGLGYLLFATFRPYLSDLIWSVVLSYGLYPQSCRIRKLIGERRSHSNTIELYDALIELMFLFMWLHYAAAVFIIGADLSQRAT